MISHGIVRRNVLLVLEMILPSSAARRPGHRRRCGDIAVDAAAAALTLLVGEQGGGLCLGVRAR